MRVSVEFVTDKVGYASFQEPVDIGPDPQVQAVVKGLLGQYKIPQEKYEEPMTSSQEVNIACAANGGRCTLLYLIHACLPAPVLQGPSEAPERPRVPFLQAPPSYSRPFGPRANLGRQIGWIHKPLVPENRRFQHKLTQGESTKFAEIYTKKMAGEHVFHGGSGKYLKF